MGTCEGHTIWGENISVWNVDFNWNLMSVMRRRREWKTEHIDLIKVIVCGGRVTEPDLFYTTVCLIYFHRGFT